MSFMLSALDIKFFNCILYDRLFHSSFFTPIYLDNILFYHIAINCIAMANQNWGLYSGQKIKWDNLNAFSQLWFVFNISQAFILSTFINLIILHTIHIWDIKEYWLSENRVVNEQEQNIAINKIGNPNYCSETKPITGNLRFVSSWHNSYSHA